MDDFGAWIGRSEQRSDTLLALPAAMLDAALDRPAPGLTLPPLRHWLYFHQALRRADTGSDGHPKRGDFLPPVELPRRMWAAGEIEFKEPLRMGAAVSLASTIRGVSRKRGRGGDLVFVDIEHLIAADGAAAPAIVETQRLVYRSEGAPAAEGAPATQRSDWESSLAPDEILLFRYAALTANAHRIHYDRSYATAVEGYRDLVVQGPLQATLLVDAWRDACPGAAPRRLSYRALAPSYVGEHLVACGRASGPGAAELWLRRADGTLGMSAQLAFDAPA